MKINDLVKCLNCGFINRVVNKSGFVDSCPDCRSWAFKEITLKEAENSLIGKELN